MIIYLLSCKCEPLKLYKPLAQVHTGAVSHRHHHVFSRQTGGGLLHTRWGAWGLAVPRGQLQGAGRPLRQGAGRPGGRGGQERIAATARSGLLLAVWVGSHCSRNQQQQIDAAQALGLFCLPR